MLSTQEAGPTLTAGGATSGPEHLQLWVWPLRGMWPGSHHNNYGRRATSTRALYTNRWKLFLEWCGATNEVPESASLPVFFAVTAGKAALCIHLERFVMVPSWDLLLVLEAQDKNGIKWLSAMVAFLSAMASVKRASELHALSVSEVCMHLELWWHRSGTLA